MEASDLRDAFDNELRRGIIENHPMFPDWYATLTPRTQHIIDNLLEEDVTPELIDFAQQTMQEENSPLFFIQFLADGNPQPNVALALTNMALGDIALHVLCFGKNME